MTWILSRSTELADGTVRWESLGEGPPIVLVHGTPYSSFLWRDVAVVLARRGRHVYGRKDATLQNCYVSGTSAAPA
jgi:pimeloyl-ACP methyl ester carboxylesterase